MRLLPALVAALLLAGCTRGPEEGASGGGAADPTRANTAGPALDANATVDAPAWSQGDAWRVETHDGDEHAQSTLVVTEAGSDAYIVSTTSDTHATYDATFDVSYLGRIRASDLSGSQLDVPVVFFDFPLADGKTWETAWDRTTITLTATFAPAIPTPLGPQPGFAIAGTDPSGALYVTYDYVPALRWWTHLDFAAGYGFTVTGVAENWTGEVSLATSKELLSLTTAAPFASTPAGTFTVDEGQTNVMMTLTGQAGPFARGLVVVDPEHDTYPKQSANYESHLEATRFFLTETMPAKPGAWHVLAPTLHAPEGSLTLTFTQVAVEKRAV